MASKSAIAIRRLLAGVIFLASPFFAFSQEPQKQQGKFSPVLKQRTQSLQSDEETIFILCKNTDSLRSLLQNKKSVKVLYEYRPARILVIKTTWRILQPVLSEEQIVFVEIARKPNVELIVSSLNKNVNKINWVHSVYPGFNGSGQVISLKEDLPDTADIDFKGRYLSTTLTSSVPSTHASNMASIIAGAGNSYFQGKGVAWGATISSAGFDHLLPNADSAYKMYNIAVQNHSYGTGIENYYGIDAAAYDASVIAKPSLLHVFSAGNSGHDTDTSGIYKGLTGFANITGSFKMAKNIIAVGHVDSIYQIPLHSSKGPAYDGRIKPELVAFGQDGSSGAAATVAGTALLLQHAYKALKGTLPDAALMKAIIINSADDAGPAGIDFFSGYGNLNASRALETIIDARYLEGTVSNGEAKSYPLTVPPGLKQLKLTLTWTDPPAEPNATKALVNNLDLSLGFTGSDQIWLPWVLNSTANIDSLKLPPVRKSDSLNNTEQISIAHPAPGEYVLNVKGFSVKTASSQPFSIAYQFDSLDTFQWYFPTMSDNIHRNSTKIIRWSCTYADSTGKLEYSLDKGSTWTTIDNAVSLTRGYCAWSVPDAFSEATLRITIGNASFTSDSFIISGQPDLGVGFNCPDSFLLKWNTGMGQDSFMVMYLAEKYMQAFRDVNDSVFAVSKSSGPSLYYTVAPLINNREGIRSYALDYRGVKTGCYVKMFDARLFSHIVKLNLKLGTLYNVRSITWQKYEAGVFKDLKAISPVQDFDQEYTDNSLLRGINMYKVKIELTNNQVRYSDVASAFYTGTDLYTFFPNPVPKNQALYFVSNETGVSNLRIFNSLGVKIWEQKVDPGFNVFLANRFASGTYLFEMSKGGKRHKTFKVVLY